LYRSPQWKTVASVAALGALGIGGFALADTRRTENPPAITLADSQSITTTPQTTVTTNLGFGPLSDLDSPFDVSATGDGDPSMTGNTPQGLDSITGDTPVNDDDDDAAPEGDDDIAEHQEDSPAESTASAEEPESPDTADESPEG
jgi:hypothetical protein